MVGNWLVCAVLNFETQTEDQRERWSFRTDPLAGDGILYDSETEEAVRMEHVLAARWRSDDPDDPEALILREIVKKSRKGGASYAGGKALVVLNGVGGRWHQNRVASKLPKPLHFGEVYVLGLESVGARGRIYTVALLDPSDDDAPFWRVRIAPDVTAWTVERGCRLVSWMSLLSEG